MATDASLRDRARRRVLAVIRENLGGPTLRLDRIAAGIGYSKRYLHKLFESERETLAAALWRLRLERARRDFADPAQAGRSITGIAFSRGFSSWSHFSRAFRDRYGVPPRLFRTMAAGGGAD